MPVRHDDAIQLLRYELGATVLSSTPNPRRRKPGGSSVPRRKASPKMDENEQQQQQPDNAWDAPEREAYPEVSDNPHNHTYTWSPKLPDGSMLVIRSQTAAGLVSSVEALGNGLLARLTGAWQQAQNGGASAPQAPQQNGWQGQQSYPQNNQPPNQPYQGQPAWQQAGAPQGQGGGYQQPKQYPPGWMKLNVPFKAKPVFDGIVQQNGFRKGDPGNGGQLSFNRDNKTWYVDGAVAGAFAQFGPVPA